MSSPGVLDPFNGRFVMTGDPVTYLPPEESNEALIERYQLVTAAQLAGLATDAEVAAAQQDADAAVTAATTAKQSAAEAVLAAGTNLAAVPAQSRTALIGLGYLPRIVWSGGWPTRTAALTAMGLAGYVGAVRWDSSKTTAATAPTTALRASDGSWEDEWERKKA